MTNLFDPVTNALDYEAWHILRRYLDIPNTDQHNYTFKFHGLVSCGMTEEQAEELCRPKEIEREQVMQDLAESCAKERRALDRWNRKHNPQAFKPKKSRKPKYSETFTIDGPIILSDDLKEQMRRNQEIDQSQTSDSCNGSITPGTGNHYNKPEN